MGWRCGLDLSGPKAEAEARSRTVALAIAGARAGDPTRGGAEAGIEAEAETCPSAGTRTGAGAWTGAATDTGASEGGAVVFLLMRRKKLSLMCRPRARLREADLMLRKNIVILLHHVHNQRYRHRQFDVCYVL